MTSPGPIMFTIGSLSVRWYGFLIGMGILIGVYLACIEAKRFKISSDDITDIALLAVPMGVIGARLYYVIFEWSYYANHLKEIFMVWHGGLGIHGAIIGGALGMIIMTRKKDIDLHFIIDSFIPSLVLAQAIGRWGNFFNEEAYGYAVDKAVIPWAMYIDGAYRHPCFLYESLWCIGVFLILVLVRRWNRSRLKPWDITAMYAVLYSCGRVWIEYFRTDSLYIGPFKQAQVISVCAIIVGLTVITLNRTKFKNNTSLLGFEIGLNVDENMEENDEEEEVIL